jgi:hydroxypyruvate isomerase
MAPLRSRHIDRLSLNLGWTFPEMALPDRIYAAGRAGFRHVECHMPYAWSLEALRRALDETGVDLLSLNAPLGGEGQLGLAAIEGAEDAFLDGVREAISYAVALNAPMIHVLCGRTAVAVDSEKRVVANFRRAGAIAADHGLILLMEPLNPVDNPGYFLHRTAQALELIDRVSLPNVRLMLDCYHVGKVETEAMPIIRAAALQAEHIQIAAVPSQAEPDVGTLDYAAVFDLLDEVGYAGKIGAEYVPRAAAAASFDWLDRLDIMR